METVSDNLSDRFDTVHQSDTIFPVCTIEAKFTLWNCTKLQSRLIFLILCVFFSQNSHYLLGSFAEDDLQDKDVALQCVAVCCSVLQCVTVCCLVAHFQKTTCKIRATSLL